MSKEPREYFEEKIAAQIGEIKAELDEMEYNEENELWDPETEEAQELEDLRFRLQKLEEKLGELRASSDEVWPSIREELEADLAALNEALEQTP